MIDVKNQKFINSMTKCFSVDCEWGEWQKGDCSVSCGGGMQTYIRVPKVNASNGGMKCSGESSINFSCNTENCPSKCFHFFHSITYIIKIFTLLALVLFQFHYISVHGNWSTDTAFSMCSASCGEGTKTKVILCNNPKPQYGGNNCTCDDDNDTTKYCDGLKKVLEEQCNKKQCPGM